MSINEIKDRIKEAGLKATTQRIAVLDAIYKTKKHPTAEQIILYVRKNYPSIASGTVYKVLDVLVEKKLVNKVKTERDIMRYDGIMEQHHHLYCSECDQIEDYHDDELDKILREYFEKKIIKDFELQEIKLQINGKFLNHNNKNK